MCVCVCVCVLVKFPQRINPDLHEIKHILLTVAGHILLGVCVF